MAEKTMDVRQGGVKIQSSSSRLNRRGFLKSTAAVGTLIGAMGSVGSVRAQEGLVLGYYSGTTTTEILYLDAFGNALGSQAYQNNVLVRVGSPAVAGDLQEPNPFNLYVIPDPPSITGNEGVWEIHSALGFSEQPGEVVVSPITGQEVPNSAGGIHVTGAGQTLFQFWSLELPTASEFSGVLTDPHNQEALVINLINAQNQIAPGITLPWPYPMAAGTELAGTSDGTNLSLFLSGASIDTSRQFAAEVQATRFA